VGNNRVPIPSETSADIRFRSDHTCCVCRKPGLPIQIHHLDENSSNNDPENLAVLCLICHDKTQVEGGFGRKLDSAAIKTYREDWYSRVRSRRDKADELAVRQMSLEERNGSVFALTPDKDRAASARPCDESLYICSLPGILAAQYAVAKPSWDSQTTVEMANASEDIIDLLAGMLAHLATYFPDRHFGNVDSHEYFSYFIHLRYEWHRNLIEKEGKGTSGTVLGPVTSARVLDDVKDAVEEMVAALHPWYDDYDLDAWRNDWRKCRYDGFPWKKLK
jgi:hypothetical protein